MSISNEIQDSVPMAPVEDSPQPVVLESEDVVRMPVDEAPPNLNDRMEMDFAMLVQNLSGLRTSKEQKVETGKALIRAKNNDNGATTQVNVSTEGVLNRISSIETILQEVRATLTNG